MHSRSPDRRDYRLDEEVVKIENGGLFNRDRCRNLTE